MKQAECRINMPGEKCKKWFTPKTMAILLTIVYAVSLLPLLIIGSYNRPSADDYTNGSRCYQMWQETHSVFAVLGEALARTADEWISWRGCFTSSFLSALSPNLWGEEYYILTVWIVLIMLTVSTTYLLHIIFVKVFKADKYVAHCVAMLMLFISVQCVCSQGRVEAFYWYSGAINYTFVHGMSLLFYGGLLSAVCEEGKKRNRKLAAASILGFLIGGGNQLTALNAVIVMATAAVFLFVTKKWKKYKSFMIPMLLCFAGFILNVVAPGNFVRAGGTEGMNPVKAVLVSFYYCLDYCVNEWSGWTVALLVLALIPLFWHMAGQTSFSFAYPGAVVLFGYCVVSAMMTPSLFATGNVEAARLQALVFFMYILVLTLCVGYVTGWARKKVKGKAEKVAAEKACFTGSEIGCLLSALVFFVLAAGITVIPEPDYFTVTSAITDLANGSAREYGDALSERIELYNSGEKDIVVEPLTAQPALLYFSDIKSDPEDWENRGVCRYYGINSVKVEEK